MYRSLFIHLPTKGHLGCFQVLAIMRGHQRVVLFPALLPQSSPPPFHMHTAQFLKPAHPSQHAVSCSPHRAGQGLQKPDPGWTLAPTESGVKAPAPLLWWKDWGPEVKEPQREGPPHNFWQQLASRQKSA